jgi:TetR/AcrR family tetracycline transcriptional repressor
LSLLPYPESRRPRRRSLDRDKVVQAALAVLDEVGLDQLTMRRLAERLGVKAASLYRHVRDKEELLVLLADAISGEIQTPRATLPWQRRLAELARGYRRRLLAHRDAARLLAETSPVGPRRLRHIETVLSCLRSAGLRRRDAARVAHHLNNFVTEFAADEARYAAAAAAMGGTRGTLLASARAHFRALPRDEFPTIVELADELVCDDADGLFELGLRVWLRAVAELAEAPGSRRARRASARGHRAGNPRSR